MQVERKYEQWKSITESDFVTLFIKTLLERLQRRHNAHRAKECQYG